MIKKISAIVLALVLCLSVVVMPASAYELGSSSEIAYVVELDKDSYSAGETVTVKLFLYGKSGLEFGTGAIIVGCNTAVFDQSENTATDVRDGSVGSELFDSYYKAPSGSTWAWQTNETVLNNISSANTTAENEMFDQYIKFSVARNTSGSHDNAGSNKNGLPADEINADAENGIPVVTFQLKLKDDIADGTAINVGVPTGSMPKNYCYMNYYKTPGTATTVVKTKQATSEVVNSTTAKVGAPALAIEKEKQQIKFGVTDGEYNNTFAARTFVKFTNFSEVFDDAADALDTADGDGLLEVGFVYKVGAFDETTAKNYIADAEFGDVIGTEKSVDGYTIDRHAYVSTSVVENGYAMGATINNIPAADKTTNITVLAYAKYTTGGDPVYAYCPVSGTFETLYNTYYGQAFPG